MGTNTNLQKSKASIHTNPMKSMKHASINQSNKDIDWDSTVINKPIRDSIQDPIRTR